MKRDMPKNPCIVGNKEYWTPEHRGAGRRVLVLQADDDLRCWLEWHLGQIGYECKGAFIGETESSEAILELARDFQPEIVIADFGSQADGRFVGIEAASKIKRELGIPIIYVTNFFYNPKRYASLEMWQLLAETDQLTDFFYNPVEDASLDIWQLVMETDPVTIVTIPVDPKEVFLAVRTGLWLVDTEALVRKANKLLRDQAIARTARFLMTRKHLRQDIDMRRWADHEAWDVHYLLHTIFDRSSDLFFIKDRELKYELVNPTMARLFGKEIEDFIGLTDYDLFEKNTADHIRAMDKRILNRETDEVEVEQTRSVNGVEYVFHEVRRSFRPTHGGITWICGIARDVTGRKRSGHVDSEADVEFPSARMKECLNTARLLAATDCVVLLLGESGSGKDYLAKYIHSHSRRSDGPFYEINCAAIPADVAESELFGHEKGAFTGALSRKKGLVELAEGGTLLLNEIGELPSALQAKLLTFLDTKQFDRVGGQGKVSVDVRILAATNRELHQEIEKGHFRADLFYRLEAHIIEVPPLRDRLEDIPLLVENCVSSLIKDLGFHSHPIADESRLKRLRSYSWPGNVRQLRNVLEHALILSSGNALDVVLPEFRKNDQHPVHESETAGDDPLSTLRLLVRPPGDTKLRPQRPDNRTLVELWENYIVGKGRSIEDLAAVLGVHRTTLSKWIKDAKIAVDDVNPS